MYELGSDNTNFYRFIKIIHTHTKCTRIHIYLKQYFWISEKYESTAPSTTGSRMLGLLLRVLVSQEVGQGVNWALMCVDIPPS